MAGRVQVPCRRLLRERGDSFLSILGPRFSAEGPRGQYVPLSEQDPSQWSRPLIEEAEQHLAEAAKHGKIVGIEAIADPERLRQLDLALL